MFKENLPKKDPCLENFGSKTPLIWAAHTLTLNMLCYPPPSRGRIHSRESLPHVVVDWLITEELSHVECYCHSSLALKNKYISFFDLRSITSIASIYNIGC